MTTQGQQRFWIPAFAGMTTQGQQRFWFRLSPE
jgi:hypothetical protein